MTKKICIVGLGWLGESLGTFLHEKGYEIAGSTSSIENLGHLSKHPFYVGRIAVNETAITGDWDAFITNAAYLIINIPPKRIADIETIYPKQIEQMVNRTHPSTKVIFVSSTAVYGSSITECTEEMNTIPEKASGHAVLAAEKVIQKKFGANATILRLAGLIGPDRHPGKFLAGKRVLKNPTSKVNLIHRDDCIGLINAIIEKDCFGEIFNGCATEHPLRETYYKNAAKHLNLEAPVFEASYEKIGIKVIGNTKSKSVLDYTYIFDNPEAVFMNITGEIAIIGGGPGDKGLLTLNSFEYIKNADILMYDNLISDEILEINTTAEKIYVGRKFGDTCNPLDRQATINQLFKKHYFLGKKVVRIKSGDPYIYGRAAEEARFLTDEKIPFTVVPGISAALAAANIFNVPVTERKKSNALLICTAHTSDYSFEQISSIAHILKEGNSLALYMGLKSLDKIIPKLIEITGDAEIPINAISNVSRSNQKILSSTLGNIEHKIAQNPMEMPVVFLIGMEPIK